MRAVMALVLAAAAAVIAPRGVGADTGSRARCPGRTTVRGIDVSKWQGEVDWRAVRAAGIRFAFVRVSDGTTVLDATFARNWQAARAAGVLRGAYQYFRPEEDPVEQADLLLATMGALRAGDLPPVLDLEVSGDVEPRELVRRVGRWVERVRKATGVKPIVYTSALHWATLAGNSRRFRSHALWVAHHDVDCPITPSSWRGWTFHQHSTEAVISGISGPVDENRFRGSLRALRRLSVRSDRTAGRLWARWKVRAAAEIARRDARGRGAQKRASP